MSLRDNRYRKLCWDMLFVKSLPSKFFDFFLTRLENPQLIGRSCSKGRVCVSPELKSGHTGRTKLLYPAMPSSPIWDRTSDVPSVWSCIELSIKSNQICRVGGTRIRHAHRCPAWSRFGNSAKRRHAGQAPKCDRGCAALRWSAPLRSNTPTRTRVLSSKMKKQNHARHVAVAGGPSPQPGTPPARASRPSTASERRSPPDAARLLVTPFRFAFLPLSPFIPIGARPPSRTNPLAPAFPGASLRFARDSIQASLVGGMASSPASSYDCSFKVLLIGDSAVGKSSLLVSFVSAAHIDDDIAPTIGTCASAAPVLLYPGGSRRCVTPMRTTKCGGFLTRRQ
jgi:hypothetical protein